MIQPYLLHNSFRQYAWGSLDGIAAFLSRPNVDQTPQAEYWMGSHATAPSMVDTEGVRKSLGDLIEESPEALLGAGTARRFDGKLPFLFKVLSAASPLSLQVHPDKAQAERGYSRDNSAGIPLDSPLRNYKDKNHKPELLIAITPFRALCGFRDIDETIALLSSCDTVMLKSSIDVLSASREYTAFYRHMLELPVTTRRELTDCIRQIAGDARASRGDVVLPKTPDFYRSLGLARELAAEYPGDVGVMAPFFMNIIDLEPGQSLYLGSGILHTYIRGTGLELMASSDNVLRGGLTDKHIDIPEFLSVLDGRPYHPSVIMPTADGSRRIYRTPAMDFELSVIESDGGNCPLPPGQPSILLCAEGVFRFSRIGDTGTGPVLPAILKGTSFFIPACLKDLSIEGHGLCYLATVPDREPEAV